MIPPDNDEAAATSICAYKHDAAAGAAALAWPMKHISRSVRRDCAAAAPACGGKYTARHAIAVGTALAVVLTATSPPPAMAQVRVCVTTWGGSANGDGGLATQASLRLPHSVSFVPDGTAAGSLLVADTTGTSHTIRQVNLTTGTIDIAAGGYVNGVGYSGFVDNCLATAALLNQPRFAAPLPDGSAFLIADTFNHRIRRVDRATGMISTIAGDGTAASLSAAVATSGRLNLPHAVLPHPATPGDIYITEYGSHVISIRLTNGSLVRFAGTGAASSLGDGGPALSASFNQPRALAWGPQGELYVAEDAGNRVRVIYSNRTVGTYACTGTSGFSGDGGASVAAATALLRVLSVVSTNSYPPPPQAPRHLPTATSCMAWLCTP